MKAIRTKPLTRSQQMFIDELKKSKSVWNKIPYYVRGSVVRGLVTRGLLEHRQKDPSSAYEWITEGEVRLISEKEK